MKNIQMVFRLMCSSITFLLGVWLVSWQSENRFETLPSIIETTEVAIKNNSVSKKSIFLESDHEARAIYEAILSEQSKADEMLIINEETEVDYLNARLTNLNLPSPLISQEAIDDFASKNKDAALFVGTFNLKGRYFLMPRQEEKQMFQNPYGWERFHEKYPRAQRLLHLSEIGFNNSRTEALVGLMAEARHFNTESRFIILRKINGVWVIKFRK